MKTVIDWRANRARTERAGNAAKVTSVIWLILMLENIKLKSFNPDEKRIFDLIFTHFMTENKTDSYG